MRRVEIGTDQMEIGGQSSESSVASNISARSIQMDACARDHCC